MVKQKADKKLTKKPVGKIIASFEAEFFLERKKVTPLSDEEKGQWSEMVIGRATCPLCHQSMKVLNDDGLSGNPLYDYIENHYGIGLDKVNLCINSDTLIPNLFP
jgi:hypothetical protein